MKGFTLLEVIIVTSLLVLIATFATIGFRNFANYQSFEQTVGEIAVLVEEARVAARSAQGEEPHGVHVDTDTITVFPGATYDNMEPRNEVTTFTTVRFKHEFSDGGDQVVFSQLNGLPSATGTLYIVSDTEQATSSLIITLSGIVQ